jgi:hypothetical protein
LATGGATAAAASIEPTLFKKLRRAASGDERFGMASSRRWRQRRLARNPRINLQLEAKGSDFEGFSKGRPYSRPVADSGVDRLGRSRSRLSQQFDVSVGY